MDINVLHRQLGHINFKTIRKMVNDGLVDGVTELTGEQMKCCRSCQLGKTGRSVFRESTIRTTRPLELVHSDVCGPIRPLTRGRRYQWFVTFTDDYSRYSSVYLIHSKDQVYDKMIKFIK